jgi:uncharacterized protein (DUF1697 family)
MARYVSLLRGINVSGHRKITMAELRDLYLSLGYTDVESYLQSGNVAFSTDEEPDAAASAIGEAIGSTFGHTDVDVLIRTGADLTALVDTNPFVAAGADPKSLHVTFLADEPGAVAGERTSGPDSWEPAERAVFVHCPDGYGRTRLTNAFFERTLGVRATTRNWRTVLALLEMAGR